jgi:hypothetical protein
LIYSTSTEDDSHAQQQNLVTFETSGSGQGSPVNTEAFTDEELLKRFENATSTDAITAGW